MKADEAAHADPQFAKLGDHAGGSGQVGQATSADTTIDGTTVASNPSDSGAPSFANSGLPATLRGPKAPA